MSAWTLAGAALVLGVTSAPHCALMCGAPCAALAGGRRAGEAGFHAGRLVGYLGGGAFASAGFGVVGAWARARPAAQGLWTLVELAFLGLGLWWLATGRKATRSAGHHAVPVRIVRGRALAGRAAFAGLGWIAWPCGALHGALLLAALADAAPGGVLVMGAFALGPAPGLSLAPRLLSLFDAPGRARLAVLGWRCAGMALAFTSGVALWVTLHERIAACVGGL